MKIDKHNIEGLVEGDAFDVEGHEHIDGTWQRVRHRRRVVRVLKDAVVDDTGQKWRRSTGYKSPAEKAWRYGAMRAQIVEETWQRMVADEREASEIATRLHRVFLWDSLPVDALRRIAAIIDEVKR